MKNIIMTAVLALACFTAAAADTSPYYTKDADGNFVPVLTTNAVGVPFLSGPGMDMLSSLTTATNWGVASGLIYMPSSSGHGSAVGGFATFLYNITPNFAAGLGIDLLDNQVTMPSCQFQAQVPFLIGGTNGITVTPLAFTGVATPIGGMGADNGSVVGLFGAGLDVKVYGGFGAGYAIEQRTGQPAPWHLFFLRFSKAF